MNAPKSARPIYTFADGDTSAPNAAIGQSELDTLRVEVARLRRDNHRLMRDMENLRASAKLMSEELDTQALTKVLSRQACVVLGVERALVGIVQDEVVELRMCFCNGQHRPMDDLHLAYGEGLSGMAALKRQPQVVNEPADDSRISNLYREHFAIRNALCVPIANHRGHTIGVIELHNRRDGGIFTQEDVRLVQMLSVQAAVGLDRAQLFNRIQEWAQSLETLLAFNAAINAQLDPSQLVRRLVENAARFLKADGGRAGLALPVGPEGEVVMVSDAYWTRGNWHEQPGRWQRNQGLPGFMLESEFPYVSNAYADDRLADAQLVERFGVQRALCVPIKDTDSQVIGFFELHNGQNANAFTWQDAGFLESLANTTAVAIRNAQLVRALELKNEQIQALSAHHVLRLEEERRHIARELHDEAGQALIGIKLGLQAMARRMSANHPEVRVELDQLREHVNVSTAQLKDLARRLRPPTLDELGLVVAIRQLASDYEQKTGISMYLELAEFEARLPQAAEIALYRIAQEALTNIAKYAGATRVWLSLVMEGRAAQLVIVDDGLGFDVNVPRMGMGLLGMKERASMLGGEFAIDSRPGEGTHIAVTIPL